MTTQTIVEQLKPGQVVEWWVTDTPKMGTQHARVIQPTCLNSGQMDHAGQCSCAPSLEEWRKAQLADFEYIAMRTEVECDEEREYFLAVAAELATCFITPVEVGSDPEVGGQKELTRSTKVIGSTHPKMQTRGRTRR